MPHASANRFCWAALLPLATLPALADSATPALEACTRISDDRARLQCYDRELGVRERRDASASANAGSAAPSSATPGAPSAAAPGNTRALTDEQKMGLSAGRIQQMERPASAPPTPKEMSAEISGQTVDGNGHQVFTLANGQVWRQVELDQRFAARSGDTVVISKGLLGAYFMSLGKHSTTRVSRVR